MVLISPVNIETEFFYDEDWVSDYVENLSATDTGLASLLALDESNEEARNIDHVREQLTTLLDKLPEVSECEFRSKCGFRCTDMDGNKVEYSLDELYPAGPLSKKSLEDIAEGFLFVLKKGKGTRLKMRFPGSGFPLTGKNNAEMRGDLVVTFKQNEYNGKKSL